MLTAPARRSAPAPVPVYAGSSLGDARRRQEVDEAEALEAGDDVVGGLELRLKLGQPRRGIGKADELDIVDLRLQDRQRRVMRIGLVAQHLLVVAVLLDQAFELREDA